MISFYMCSLSFSLLSQSVFLLLGGETLSGKTLVSELMERLLWQQTHIALPFPVKLYSMPHFHFGYSKAFSPALLPELHS